MKKQLNSLRIEFTNFFEKQRKSAPHEIRVAFRESLTLFIEDPSNSHLRNHPLQKKLAGYKSINITEDWRALFKEAQTGKQKIITFHKIGTHEELYGK